MSGLELEHADPLFKRLSGAKLPDAARAHTPSDVAEERWSRDDMFCLDPIFSEVRGKKPGRWAKKKPKGYPATLHLLDTRGRVLAMLSEYDFGDGVCAGQRVARVSSRWTDRHRAHRGGDPQQPGSLETP